MRTETDRQRRAFLALAGTLGITTLCTGTEALLMTASAQAAQNVPLRLRNAHTSEAYDVQLFVGSDWNPAGLVVCDWMMRDWRENQVVHCDRKLYAALYVLQRYFKPREPLQINSGFRSAKTNAMLRGKSLGESGGKASWMTPAVNSLHTKARAVDFVIPGQDLDLVEKAVWDMAIGGLGKYPRFVHMDTGARRTWGR